MRTIATLVVAMAGLATAVLWMPAHDSKQQLAVVTEIATLGIARIEPAEAEHARPDRVTGRTFSPETPLLFVQSAASKAAATRTEHRTPPAVQVASAEVAARAGRAVLPINPAAPVITRSQSFWPVDVFGSNRAAAAPTVAAPKPSQVVVAVKVVATGAVQVPTGGVVEAVNGTVKLRPTSDDEAYELARALQRELRRVGCYDGDIDGDWGPGSKRGMSAFTSRVNASLPVDEPDYILLTLVKGQAGQTCGVECPRGQIGDAGGRCVPRAVLAQASRLVNDAAQRTHALPVGRSARPAETTRTAQAIASTPAPRVAQDSAQQTARRTVVVADARPVAATRAPVFALPRHSGSVLPGRMSIGAPLPQMGTPARDPRATESVTIRTAAIPDADQASASAATERSIRRLSPPASRRTTSRRAKARPSHSRAVVAYRAPRRVTSSRSRRSTSWTANFYNNSRF